MRKRADQRQAASIKCSRTSKRLVLIPILFALLQNIRLFSIIAHFSHRDHQFVFSGIYFISFLDQM